MVRASGGGVTPVPIPNTAVKAPRGDDTAFKSAGKQRGANRFLKAPGSPKGIRGPFPYGGEEPENPEGPEDPEDPERPENPENPEDPEDRDPENPARYNFRGRELSGRLSRYQHEGHPRGNPW